MAPVTVLQKAIQNSFYTAIITKQSILFLQTSALIVTDYTQYLLNVYLSMKVHT